MNNKEVSDMILSDASRLVQAIETGAAWELWLQVELQILFRQTKGVSVGREIPFPAPYASQSLDFLLGVGAASFAIELKVESATNAGNALMTSLATDIAKIVNFKLDLGVALSRWVIAIGYSSVARASLAGITKKLPTGATAAIYNETQSIGVLIVTV